MIELSDIWRTYTMGDEKLHALAGVSETVEAGEHVAVMGPSGSGKSTLLNVLGCLDRPTSGSYRLAGREVAELSDAELSRVRQREIGFVFQSYHLVARLDAAANVELPMIFAGVSRSERKERVRRALEAVGVESRSAHRPAEMSGGQRQRVAIARATVMEPKILLADEPTGNLDSASGAQVLELLDRMSAAGLTLIVVTHDPGVARRADRVVILDDGCIARRMPGSEVTDLARLFSGSQA
ncbi:MAG: ABC transporter ATP-binding protein [Planctomycetota bacterium]|jgi:putative ABC transport system ATP-binding protein|nr:ABC transporter ATP-binding protein [Planctomycetota bacterium]MDP6763649.1 ABC transporter ATP-binding protein [Planctomycetota bacterium]MDP6990922.1 ABC transporter ATP-binding protein [Planctomycetota bacterium]